MALRLSSLIGNKARQLNAKKDAQGRSIYGTAGWQGDRREEGYGGFQKGGQAYEQLGDDPSVWQHATYDPQYGYIAPLGKIGEMDLTKAPGGNLALAAILALSGGAAIGAMGAGGAAGAAGAEGIAGAGAAEAAGTGIANYSSLSGTLGGGLGTAAAGGAADAALLGGGAVNAAAVSPYSLASGVGGGLGGAATLGGAGAALPYSLGSPSTSGAGSAAQTIGTGATALGPGAATTAGSAAAQTALSKFLSGETSLDDYLKIAGAVAPGVLGYLGASDQTDTLKGIYDQQRADRAPALAKYNEALANPNEFYKSAPAMGSVDAILRKLSMEGNPANNPGSLSKAAAYNLGGYNNYLSGLAGPAFGGQATQAQLGTNIAQAGGGQYDAIGLGLGRLLNPQPSPEETLAKYLNIGGMRWS